MEATLLYFILDVATVLVAHIAQHLAEHPFQRVVTNLSTSRSFGIFDRLVAVIADIEGGAVEVTGVLGGIAVTAAQFGDILLRTEHTGHNDLMHGDALDIQTVEERLTDILQQHGGTRHQVGNAGVKRVDMEIGIGAHIDQFALTRLGILTVLDRRDAPLLGSHQLYGIGIGKRLGIAGDGSYLMDGGTRKVEGGICRWTILTFHIGRNSHLREEQTDCSQ